MSFDNKYLAIRLEGPLQSWGVDSQYSRRNTALMPTKSAIAGMCCAALGLPRGGDKEQEFLARFTDVRMISISIPRKGIKEALPVRRLKDYHTVQNTRTADGKTKDCHITYRHYLSDASFGVILVGASSLLKGIADALADPIWGIWLGRKTCVPSAPVFAGMKDNLADALSQIIGDKLLESFTRQEEAEHFDEGHDTLPDTPLSFATDRRLFSPRRVRTIQGAGS